MTELRRTILEQLSRQEISCETAKRLILALQDAESDNRSSGIAVIGMDCRFAKADSIKEYWENIKAAKSCIGKPTAARLRGIKESFEQHYHLNVTDDLINEGGYLSQIDQFDAHFFSMLDKEAYFMDPWQRILLETSYHAVEDAGITMDELYGSDTMVFIGRDNYVESSYGKMIDDKNPFALSGSYAAVLASRISHFFNLLGANMVIDTACSSAMTALNRAYSSLMSGECKTAIVGGINILENIFRVSGNSMERILTKENKVRSFDKDAKGTILSEGVGVLILRKYSEEVKRHNNVYAVIRGIASNCDGGVKNISSPNVESETSVITTVWRNAGINPEEIKYIEAHGTGTLVGDSIEFKAISAAFKEYTDKTGFCALGAAKSVIGHSVAASGMASIMKAILCMKNNLLPMNANYSNPNPHMDLENSALFINDQTREWKDSPKLCGVNSFGYSGVNVHVLLEAAENEAIQAGQHDYNIFVLSAASMASLHALVKEYAGFVNKDSDISYLCNNLAKGRNHFEHRLAIVVRTAEELREKLQFVATDQGGVKQDDEKQIYYQVTETSRKKRRRKKAAVLDNESNLSQIGSSSSVLSDAEQTIAVAKEYVSGKDIKWEDIYQEELPMMHLPLYCFEHHTYWYKAQGNNEQS